MSKKYFDLAKKYGDVLKLEGINLKGLYVFGSRAKGKGKKWSDLDIGIISDDFGDDRIAGMSKLFYLGTKVSDLIEPHLFTSKEFGHKYDVLAQEIKRTGIRII